MTIYASYKVMPYVYMCVHKTSGEFYIGSRTTTKQTLPSNLDFPIYRTSSTQVKPIFDQFNWYIVAEFLDANSAYDAEQILIYEHWGDLLLLNKSCCVGKGRLLVTGTKWTTERKLKASQDRKGVLRVGQTHRLETKQKMANAKLGKPGIQHTPNSRDLMSRSHTGKKCSTTHIQNIAKAKAGFVWWNNGCTTTQSAAQPGTGWVRGRLPIKHTALAHKLQPVD